MKLAVLPGKAEPLGATWDGAGTNFSVFSAIAEHIELCLFDAAGLETRVRLPAVTAAVHHGYLRGVAAGQRYGFRVHGPWAPAAGHLANPAKLVLDPYARAIEGDVRWGPEVYAQHSEAPARPQPDDSARFVPRSVVIDPSFDWGDDRAPRTPWRETLIYEAHVRGFTIQHPDVPPESRGSYAALAHPAAIDYLRGLGVTAIELLPVHAFIPERAHLERGLTNYWGYSTIGYFAPHAAYASTGRAADAVRELKEAVRALHAAGIEVILDVVYNHTAEGGQRGPTLCFRGLDNDAYYRSRPDSPRYVDYTGTGNTLDLRHPRVLQLVLDSLRHWITEYHIDGFRFDLAASLGRDSDDFGAHGAFLEAVRGDPLIARSKLIAEPWDTGDSGYQLGNFPPPWSEWNDRYRDTVRDLWRGHTPALADFGRRLTGSADLFNETGRAPAASINFVTVHDGFPLADLVAYDHKHNEANGEDNRDGNDGNRSWNSGAEGPTSDPDVLQRRGRRARALLATLFLSQGTPLLLGGDELGRTQQGNNNAYCQDNAISWFDWEHADADLREYVAALARFRRAHPVLSSPRWLDAPAQGGATAGGELAWFTPRGAALSTADWEVPHEPGITVYLDGAAVGASADVPAPDGRVLCFFNPAEATRSFTVPQHLAALPWIVAIDSAGPGASQPPADTTCEVPGWSVLVLAAPTASP